MANIIIVDDEIENLQLLKLSLGDDNPDWVIFTASDVTSCLVIVQKQLDIGDPIDLVLTDLVMTAEDSGMSIIKGVRAIDPLIMSILFTAKEKNLDRYIAFDYGAFDVVEKNIPGVVASKEIGIKARSAIQFRTWSKRVNFLQKYFDPKLFQAIEENPKILEMSSRTITIVFWDIRGFSRLCDSLKAYPLLIASFLREYCEIAAKCIFKHNGILDKFIGDGVMALFGALDAEENTQTCGVVAAIEAAVDFKREFDVLLARWLEEWSLYVPDTIDIGIGCGIHTGDALVGNVGTYFRDQFTALGPNVNFTSRIEGRAQSGEILLSQPSAARAKKNYKLIEVGEIDDIKNISGSFKLFKLE